jgi:hypothetical protein
MTTLAPPPPLPPTTPGPGLNGWHPGETALHNKLSFPATLATRYVAIEDQLREQHRIFHTSNLPFIPLTIIDGNGRPWAGIAAGRSGEIGFVTAPSLKRLVVRGCAWVGDPLFEGLKGDLEGDLEGEERKERALTAGLGIEFSTRRRNKFAGAIRSVRTFPEREGKREYEIEIEVNEAVGYVVLLRPNYLQLSIANSIQQQLPQIHQHTHPGPLPTHIPKNHLPRTEHVINRPPPRPRHQHDQIRRHSLHRNRLHIYALNRIQIPLTRRHERSRRTSRLHPG